MIRKINNDIYKMYEEEVAKLNKATKKIDELKLEIYVLKTDLVSIKNKMNSEINKATKSLIEENTKLKEYLNNALMEIDRLKSEIGTKKDKDYLIDKLTNRVNKNSSNSSIPTSKEIRKEKTGANIYIIVKRQIA